MIALVRTSGTPEDRHQGLSQMIVDLSLPGITVRTIGDLTGDQHFNEVFFDDVLLPHDALIGDEGAGWAQVTAELAYERSGPERIYGSMVLFDAWLQHLRSRGDPTSAELALAGRILAHLVPLREMSAALTAKLAQGDSPVIEAALVKDLGTELEQAIPNLLADALAADPLAERPEDLLRTLSYVLQVVPDLLAARRHARNPARHDRARTGAALMDALLFESVERFVAGCSTPAVVREVERGQRAAALWAEVESSGYADAAGGRAGRRRRPGPARGLRAVAGLRPPCVAGAAGPHGLGARRAAAGGLCTAPRGPLTLAAQCSRDAGVRGAARTCPSAWWPTGCWCGDAQGAALLPVAAGERRPSGVHGSLQAHVQWPAQPARRPAAARAHRRGCMPAR